MTSREQAVRAPTGLPYGQRKQLEDAQSAVPLPDNTSPASGGQGVANVQPPNVFAPTTRPGEPLTAGAAAGPGPAQLELLPPDPVAHLRALYARFPHEDLRRLLERANEGSAGRGGTAATTNAPQPPTRTSQPTGPQTPQSPNPASATPPTPLGPPTETGL
jgi:hypothetical protein